MSATRRIRVPRHLVGFDTAFCRSIQHGMDQLRTLSRRRAGERGEGARQHEQAVLVGLERKAKQNPTKFLYCMLEVHGARGKRR